MYRNLGRIHLRVHVSRHLQGQLRTAQVLSSSFTDWRGDIVLHLWPAIVRSCRRRQRRHVDVRRPHGTGSYDTWGRAAHEHRIMQVAGVCMSESSGLAVR